MARTIGRVLAGVSLALIFAAVAQAAAADKPAKKDPVELAFTLPKTAKLTPEQQEQFDRLRTDKEPELRAAWEQYQAAKDSAGKTAGMKRFNDLKKDLKAAITKILGAKDGTGTKKPSAPKVTKEKTVKAAKDKPVRTPGTLKPSHPKGGGLPPGPGF